MFTRAEIFRKGVWETVFLYQAYQNPFEDCIVVVILDGDNGEQYDRLTSVKVADWECIRFYKIDMR